jgi:hypothetical protein
MSDPTVFISYSRRDKKLMEELLAHMKPYVRSGSVTAWSDKQIVPGSKWLPEIQTALGKAGVALLLVSPQFLASDFIHRARQSPEPRRGPWRRRQSREGGAGALPVGAPPSWPPPCPNRLPPRGEEPSAL